MKNTKLSKSKTKTKVLLAMSGGVDSSVAALLLQKQGYEIIGAFMKNWSNTKNDFGECAWRDERRMAMKIANMLNIPLITLDFEKQYKKEVVQDMFNNYKKGITPNPDVICNNKIKFPLLWKEAKKRHCDFVSTGHYARIKKTNKGYFLLRAKAENKDQSYFLYRLNENDLSHTLFPIGKLNKEQVRDIAKKNHFPNFNKKSTSGICFIGKVNLKSFLKHKIKPKKGLILDPNKNKIGEHDGIYYYTIGQRIGPRFGLDLNKSQFDNKKQLKKWYVAKKDVKNNIIIAAPKGHRLLLRKEITIKQIHLINKNTKLPATAYARIRNVGELLPCKIITNKRTKQIKVILNKAITGISKGQAIVLYINKVVLGGGVIDFKD